MTHEEFKREKMYLATMSIARNMLLQDLITAEEYRHVDEIFCRKYKPIFGTLFSHLELTSAP